MTSRVQIAKAQALKDLIQRIGRTQPELAVELRRAAGELFREAFFVGWMEGAHYILALDDPSKPLTPRHSQNAGQLLPQEIR